MTEEDQRDVVAFLTRPEAFGTDRVERIVTHASRIFLAGDRAYKLKRAVRYDFLDYSTLALRREAAEREVAFNRRTAPELYLGVLPVTRRQGRIALNGSGEVVDWLVVMRRFPQADLLDLVAAKGHLTPELVDLLAREIAVFHGQAERRPDMDGAERFAKSVRDTCQELAPFAGDLFSGPGFETLSSRLACLGERYAQRLDARVRRGFVRHCHGDLHLGNIVLLDGRPTLFDAIEFSDAIACIDVIYDLAFLVMDLLHRGTPDLANRVLNGYLDATRDYGGLAPMPLFLAHRALIRAMASALSISGGQAGAEEKTALARAYFALAERLAEARSPRLVAIGGRSGTGKTTLARRLATKIAGGAGAIILRSDVTRKWLFGREPEDRLPAEAYRGDVNRRVSTRLFRDAVRALKAGQTVLLDATFLGVRDRERVAAIARDLGLAFDGLWLEAEEEILLARVRDRARDASDADVGVVRAQRDVPAGEMTWRRVRAEGSEAEVAERAFRALRPGKTARPLA